MSTPLPNFDAEALLEHPTSLRAAAAAFAMMLSGQRPSVETVAEIADTTRQNLYAHHKPVIELVRLLRASWEPPRSGELAEMTRQRDDAKRQLEKEREKRKLAESERDKAMHHLALSDAAVSELSRDRSTVVPLFGRTSKY